MDRIVIKQIACAAEDVFALDTAGRAWIWDESNRRWEALPEIPQAELREIKSSEAT